MTITADPELLPAVADRAPVRLSGHLPEGGVPVSGWGRTLFGLPFAGAGLLAFHVVHGMAPGQTSRGGAPWWVGMAGASLFAVVGLWLTLGGLAQVGERWARGRRQRRHPGQPWLADYPWERRGGRDRAPEELRLAASAFGFTGIFAVIFGWAGLFGSRSFLFTIVGLGAIAAATWAAAWVVRVVMRGARWGRSRLRFADFPMAPGGEATLLLDGLSPLARSVPLRATLRCVQERWEAGGRGQRRRMQVVHYALWSTTVDLPAGAAEARFALPAGAPGTELSRRPLRYWELELVAEVPGVDYRASFLVPVYAEAREW